MSLIKKLGFLALLVLVPDGIAQGTEQPDEPKFGAFKGGLAPGRLPIKEFPLLEATIKQLQASLKEGDEAFVRRHVHEDFSFILDPDPGGIGGSGMDFFNMVFQVLTPTAEEAKELTPERHAEVLRELESSRDGLSASINMAHVRVNVDGDGMGLACDGDNLLTLEEFEQEGEILKGSTWLSEFENVRVRATPGIAAPVVGNLAGFNDLAVQGDTIEADPDPTSPYRWIKVLYSPRLQESYVDEDWGDGQDITGYIALRYLGSRTNYPLCFGWDETEKIWKLRSYTIKGEGH
ncbi:hypothetical protein [Magnetospira sp. QH-2]|uniref:hypothetical protein n=1 Tax=Magnetospira sp. (strain QH-2) TaxID=1288970 RepID=UPI0005FA10A1|nr:hypothetical protein [Magnetospira sp. QH-2]